MVLLTILIVPQFLVHLNVLCMSGINDKRMFLLQRPETCTKVLGARDYVLPHWTLVQAPDRVVVTSVNGGAVQVVRSPAPHSGVLGHTVH